MFVVLAEEFYGDKKIPSFKCRAGQDKKER